MGLGVTMKGGSLQRTHASHAPGVGLQLQNARIRGGGNHRIDPGTLPDAHIQLFANQPPATQSEFISLLVKHGTKGLRIAELPPEEDRHSHDHNVQGLVHVAFTTASCAVFAAKLFSAAATSLAAQYSVLCGKGEDGIVAMVSDCTETIVCKALQDAS